ncbi:MAG: adenosine deaminase [Anaerolineales bacterium]|nr:adenosine deaminase [Anaerolineales bacterium]
MDTIFANTLVSPELKDRLFAMPKVEIHVHLEGATDAATVWDLAKRNNVSLPAPTLEAWKTMYEFRDFAHFIKIYHQATKCMRTPEDFAFMAERFLERQAQHNVKYCEVFLSASMMLDNFIQDEVIAALDEGSRRGEVDYGVKSVFIPDIARQMPETATRVLDFALRGKEQGLFIGLGVGGMEDGFPPELFTDVFSEARRQNLHVVAHAGEAAGPTSVWGAINHLKVERIGHGVRALEDLELVKHLQKTQIPLEVSPYSNYRLKVAPIDRPHPIRELMDRGVYVTVNSDDPSMFSTDLSSEYILLASQGFSWEELWQLNLNTLEASFAPEEEKATYRAKWEEFASQ